jgi:hypothetical protein
MPNTCWDCKYNTLKLKILVPHNNTIKEYIHKTGDFQSNIVAIVKEKQEQYTVWYRSEGKIKLLNCRFVHSCMLKLEKSKKNTEYLKYELKQEKNIISNIIYSKISSSEPIIASSQN